MGFECRHCLTQAPATVIRCRTVAAWRLFVGIKPLLIESGDHSTTCCMNYSDTKIGTCERMKECWLKSSFIATLVIRGNLSTTCVRAHHLCNLHGAQHCICFITLHRNIEAPPTPYSCSHAASKNRSFGELAARRQARAPPAVHLWACSSSRQLSETFDKPSRSSSGQHPVQASQTGRGSTTAALQSLKH